MSFYGAGMVGSYLSIVAAGTAFASLMSFSEFPVEERALVKATTDFFDAVEVEGLEKSIDFFSGAYASAVPIETWNEDRLHQLVNTGPLKHLTAYRITWYPVETLLGAVDFVGRESEGGDLVCGYVLWEFSGTSEPQLRWYEATHLDPVEIRGLAEDEVESRLLEANCAFSTIEDNITLSER